MTSPRQQAPRGFRISQAQRAGLDVRADPLRGVGAASSLDFGRDVRLVLAEAVAAGPLSWRLLLPDALADVRSREDGAVLAELHDRALRVRAEEPGMVLVARQRGPGQHGLDGDWINRSSGGSALAAAN